MSRGNIIFVGIRAVYLYQILFNVMFMSLVHFFIRLYRVLIFFFYEAVPPVMHNFR